ncbi:putative homeodomain protein class 2 [Pseudoloma neurophilia]|uniref:Putative homeodomain protein class 2 n=1 Tax=Pseudoloma neurophilia TaxID=146866 RepID=A0A0R0LRI5_9MICR|nr:putative homeodomain protein class 2 [Pseudoloma neurophilia]
MNVDLRSLSEYLRQIRAEHGFTYTQLGVDIEMIIMKYQNRFGEINVQLTKNTIIYIENTILYLQRRAVSSIEHCLEVFLFDESKKRKLINSPRKRFSQNVTTILENEFIDNPYPTEEERMIMAREHKLSPKQIANWFSNKRNRSQQNDLKH